ncbi:DUF3299 domain-containing protein [Vibrio maerlii]|uniref:DUF3299 domain-containing protein n=1 Tax=Vibrio maerlii TaxID=2231648 RepID=UPI001F12C8F2|nr:DUF3299 domain-containing protein [Vibrio maerlii]
MSHLLLIIFALVSFASMADELIELDWKQLRPHVPRTVSLPTLDYNQRAALQEVYTLMLVTNEESLARIAEIKLQFKEQGLDIEQLFELRNEYMQQEQKVAETTTSAYDDQLVRIPGFLVPLEFSSPLVASEFLLVPVAGACIHMPPPPANQIIRVSYPEGFKVETVQYPVWVEGKFNSSLHSDDVYLVDGETNVTMGYTMKATMVEDYL